MAGRYEVLSHTADTAIAVEADSFGEVCAWAARGMFATMYSLDRRAGEHRQIDVVSTARDELLVDLLSELLYVAETADVLPVWFDTMEADEHHVVMRVGTVPAATVVLEGPPIKAVTYHDLAVHHRPDGTWAAHVVFDV